MASGSLGHLAATVTLDIDPFKSSARALNSQIKATGSALRAQEAALKGYGSSLNGMKATYSSMGQQMKNYEAKLQAQKQTYQDLTKKTADTAEEQAKLTTRQANAANQYNRTSAQMEALRAKMNATQRQITLQSNGWYQAGQKVSTFGTHITNASQKLSSVGSTMTRSVTTPIVAGMGLAIKSAMSFGDEINSIGPLLTNGAAVTGKFKTQLDQMGNASKRWAQQYGISTNSINKGMADLVRAGYSANQTMKMMPAILDASRASGEDFNTVMDVVTSTMTQFGVKASRTTSVTDAMTYAANATKSGFADMGEAMKYTGQSAHAAGINLNTTVAAIGLLSNAGLQGSTAGTAFNMMLQKLTAGSMKAGSPMKKLGINIDAFKKGTIGLPEVINEVTKATAGMNKGQKVAAVTAAFGERGGRAMLALMNAGSKQLTDLTAKTGQAAGATKKVSDMMGTTAKAQFDRFKASVQVLGIEVGNNLIPAITPLVGKATEMVKAFGEMDKGTQQSIIKFALYAAAAGPVLSITSKLGSVIGGTVNGIGLFAQGIGRMQSAAKLGGTGLQILKSGFSASAYSATTFAGQAATATGALGGIEGASGAAAGGLSLLNPVVLGVTAAVVGGIAVWELWGKKALESSQISSRWGADVGSSADKALGEFQKSSSGITEALTDMDTATSTTTKSMSQSFENEFGNIEKAAKTHMKNVKETIDGLDPDVAEAVNKAAQKTKGASDKLIADAKQHEQAAQNILKGHNQSVAKLSDDQRVMLKNHQDAMANDELKALNITGNKKKAVMATLNQDYNKMSQSQRDSQIRALDDVSRATIKGMAKQQNSLKKALDSGKITQQEYNAGMKVLGDKTSAVMDKTAAQYIKLEKASGKSTATIKQDMLEQGLSYQNGMKYIEQHGQKVKNNAKLVVDETGKMSKATKDAANTWNNLVFDAKTGKVKTNAQEEVNKAVKSGKQWDQIKLLVKEGKLSTNAKEMVANAAIAEGRWNSLSWKEQKALIKSEGNEDFVKLLEDSGEWNDLTIQQKQAIVNSKGGADLGNLLVKLGVWDNLTPKEQQLVLKDNGTQTLYKVLGELGEWNQLTLKEQQAVVSGDPSGIANVLIKMDLWNNFTLKEKIAMLHAKGKEDIIDSINEVGRWNDLTPQQQVAIMTAKGKPELVDALMKFNVWNNLTPKQQQAQVKTSGAVDLINMLGQMGKWNSLNPEAKSAIVNAQGSAQLGDILTKYNLWAGLPAELVKQMIAEDKASGNSKAATDAIYQYNKANPNKKIMNSDDMVSPKIKVIGGNIGQYDQKNPKTKHFNGDASNITKASSQSTQAQDRHNNKQDKTKPFNGDPSSILKSSSQSTGAQDRHNNHRINTKKLTGDPSSILRAGANSLNAQGRHNSYHVTNKHLPGTDATTGAATSAINSINRFNGLKETVKHFKSIFTTVKETIFGKSSKNAHGTSNFEGGNMLVNDQPGSVYQETVWFPHQKQPFFPQGRNVLIPDAPKGTKVLRANLTAQLSRNLTRFAEGSLQTNRAVETILNTPDTKQISSDEDIGGSSKTRISMKDYSQQLETVNESLFQVKALLISMLSIDKKQLAAILHSGNNKELLKNIADMQSIYDVQNIRG